MSKKARWSAASVVALACLISLSVGFAATRSSGIPPSKQQILDNEQADRASASRAPKAHPLVPAAASLSPRTPGILDMHQGPFSASEFSVTNFWQGPVAGQWLLVYAGGSPSTDGAIATGGLRIYSEPVDPNTGSEPTFIGQYSDGSSGLSIISATGRDLKLRSDQGDSLSFDLVAKTFGAAG